MTTQELFDSLFFSYGYRDYTRKYCDLLIPPMPDRTEAEFIKAMAEDADSDLFQIESTANEIAKLTQRAFRLFRLMSEHSDSKKTTEFPTIQKALHEAMMNTLYHICCASDGMTL